MKISIITVTYNGAATLADCIASVAKQSYRNIEHLIIDGASTDGTLELVKANPGRISKLISEPDCGIYDAMNKGIRLATGDVIGILNSDDFFSSEDVIERIVQEFQRHPIDAVYGDVCFVKPENLTKTVRYYSAQWFQPAMFRFGFMPPHPSFYVRRKRYEELGLYQPDYKIAADYELLIRFLKVAQIKTRYLGFCVVTMRTGGDSTKNLKSNWILNREIVRGCRENNISTNMFILSFKYLLKISGVLFPNRNTQLVKLKTTES